MRTQGGAGTTGGARTTPVERERNLTRAPKDALREGTNREGEEASRRTDRAGTPNTPKRPPKRWTTQDERGTNNRRHGDATDRPASTNDRNSQNAKSAPP